MTTQDTDQRISELAQKLYSEDGWQGDLYTDATPAQVNKYEDRAQAIIEGEKQ